LRRKGYKVDLTPEEHRGEALVTALAPLMSPSSQVLLPQADDARPALAEGLRGAGAHVEVLIAYRKALPVEAAATAQRLFDDSPLGWVTMTSPRIVHSFASLFGESWPERRRSLLAASIGPVTSEALRSQGVSPSAQAAQPSDRALVDAVAAAIPS